MNEKTSIFGSEKAGALAAFVNRDEAVSAARAIADKLARVIVDNEDQAKVLADQLHTIRTGRLRLEAIKKAARKPYADALAEVTDYFTPLLTALTRAEAAGKNATAVFLQHRRLEQQRIELERQKQLAAQAAAASQEAQEEIPPAEAPPVDRATQIRGAAGGLHGSRVLDCEIEVLADVPPEWVTLRKADAKEEFRRELTRGNIDPAASSNGRIVWNGVAFFYRDTVVSTSVDNYARPKDAAFMIGGDE